MENNFSEKEKLSTLVTRYPGILLLLSHFNIPLGFGEKTVEQVCRQHGIDSRLFLLIANVYIGENYLPSLETLHATPIDKLILYFKRSHAYYLEKRLPHIGSHLEKIALLLPERASRGVLLFYKQYMTEVKAHFEHEERDVFPHVERLLRGESDKGFSMSRFIDLHGNLEDTLSDLAQLIFKYMPGGEADDDTIDMIFDILQLAHDLHKHSIIEEKIMVPYIEHLERSAKS